MQDVPCGHIPCPATEQPCAFAATRRGRSRSCPTECRSRRSTPYPRQGSGLGRLRTEGVQLSARRGEDSASLALDWAFGSGLKGITAVGRSEDGRFVESSLTWYASLAAFDLTTGATQYDRLTVEDGLGRRLSQQEVAECFGCHTTGYDRRRQAPARKEMGVRCERCHGPGAEHVRSAASGSVGGRIFHPGKLEPFAQVQMCGACHGTPPQDNDLDAIRYVETTLKTVRFPSQRLVLSRCFNESMAGLKCTTCHDSAHERRGGARKSRPSVSVVPCAGRFQRGEQLSGGCRRLRFLPHASRTSDESLSLY